MREQIEEVLKQVRPQLQADGGDIEFVDVDEEGNVKVKLLGACHGCPMSQMTLAWGVERILKEKVPGVSSVVPV
jgi:Fe-S cluster biogenesis protein NfuA